jgi:hypothetical protein
MIKSGTTIPAILRIRPATGTEKGKTMGKLAKTSIISVSALLLGSAVARADQTVVLDDWNDRNWTAIVPDQDWITTSGAGASIDVKRRQGPTGSPKDAAVRWLPKKSNPTTPSMYLEGLGAYEADSDGWSLRWDERWYPTDLRRTSSQIISQSRIVLEVSVPGIDGTPVAGSWVLERSSPDSGGQTTLTASFGGSVIHSLSVDYPDGFSPLQGEYLRYYWERDLDTRQMTLVAVELDSRGDETDTAYTLLEFDSTVYGALTSAGALAADSNLITRLEFGAPVTEDGFDANADNVTLSTIQSLRPANLDDFVNVNDYASLEEAIDHETHIYLPQGTYLINNPVTIDQDSPLFLFGAGMLYKTVIRAANPQAPLFEVEEAPHIGVSGIEFWTGSDAVTDARAFAFTNDDPVRFEAQDCAFYRYTVGIGGPGDYVLQGCLWNGRFTGNTDALVVDHQDARVWVVGGGAIYYQRSFVNQKQGHLEVYGASMGFIGTDDTDPLRADFRIESASPLTAHVIAGIRSEGTKMQHAAPFLYVPTTDSPVDIVIKCNNSSYTVPGSDEGNDPGPIVNYNGAGTLWMLGHIGRYRSAESLVAGYAPGATIVAIGNQFEGGDGTPPDMLPVDADVEIFAGNIYDYEHSADPDDPTLPNHRFVNPTATIPPETPPVPVNALNGAIPKLDRPVINSPAPAGFLVDVVAAYGADPADSAVDDWPAIQAALDNEGPHLYFPPGTYNLSAPLEYHKTGDHYVRFSAGGLFAGAGSGQTVLKVAPDVGNVFSTQGMAHTVWQGISFVVPEAKADSGSCFEIENVIGVGDASTFNNFYDCSFSGGRFAFSLGLTTSANSDVHLLVDCAFSDAVVGLANGSWNAVNNFVHGGRFTDNDFAIGGAPWDDGLYYGGCWGVFSAVMTGSAIDDLSILNHLGKHYHNRIVGDGNGLGDSLGFTTYAGSLFFEQCTLAPVNPSPYYLDYSQGGAVTFLHSQVTGGHQRYVLQGSQGSVISLHSDIAEWDTIELVPPENAKKHRLP